MGYILGQYNKTKNDGTDNNFMSFVNNGIVTRIGAKDDNGVSAFYNTGTGKSLFYDEAIQLDGTTLSDEKSYYFHGKIKRMSSTQVFDIKLIHSGPEAETTEQYIKTITVAAGDIHEWVDLEFIFNPYQKFDIILFELRRVSEDYRTQSRYPKIIYEELSEINNLISFSSSLGEGKKLLKIGVQSRPGLLMCINGEEIRSSRTGVYELKQGIIVINFFSVVTSAEETSNILITKIEEINEDFDDALKLSPIKPEGDEFSPQEQALWDINSVCLWNTSTYPKTRTIDNFTLDYLYREE